MENAETFGTANAPGIKQVREQDGTETDDVLLTDLPKFGLFFGRSYIDKMIKSGEWPAPRYLSARKRVYTRAQIAQIKADAEARYGKKREAA